MPNILIVDDKVKFREELVWLLNGKTNDYHILTADDSRMARKILDSSQVDLVLAGFRTSESDPLELLVHIASKYPAIPVIVVTPFGVPPMDTQLNELGVFKILPKPIAVTELNASIKSGLEAAAGDKVRSVISLDNLLQLVAVEQKTCLIEVRIKGWEKKKGLFYFHSGELHDAVYEDFKGDEAALAMLALKDVKISFRKVPQGRVKRRITAGLMSLLMEGAKRGNEPMPEARSEDDLFLRDEDLDFFNEEPNEKTEDAAVEMDWEEPADQEEFAGEDEDWESPLEGEMGRSLPGRDSEADSRDLVVAEDEAFPDRPDRDESIERIEDSVTMKHDADESAGSDSLAEEGDEAMGQFQEHLEKLKDIDGFLGAGIFSPHGEMVESLGSAGTNMAELGALANDILLKAQKTSEVMGVGRGNMVHIQAPKAHVLVRCLNEATDFTASSAGRAHIHMLVVVDPEGNLAFAKMKLDTIIQDLAPSFR